MENFRTLIFQVIVLFVKISLNLFLFLFLGNMSANKLLGGPQLRSPAGSLSSGRSSRYFEINFTWFEMIQNWILEYFQNR